MTNAPAGTVNIFLCSLSVSRYASSILFQLFLLLLFRSLKYVSCNRWLLSYTTKVRSLLEVRETNP